ncbi:uncharacterized protein B0I36DRAFT_347985 [Microdochium trichocladiopsis]|uniref:Protein transport protein sec73 n=1 Tax=Microdochium trichocladiopsis TaxID=1682393 RepID=A0A9P8Y7X7_9PEZI|nr:uncharacterized protein B0I36DRAFT_347985 [Microdochium trichocladiopsis]KAH7032824.1 hypothetical protein B0I36DRAFT_347985 [Microdochium trichocladiopsis]
MPFLRRRGVNASESDMRRHTILLDPVNDGPISLPRKSEAEETQQPDPAAIPPIILEDTTAANSGENGGTDGAERPSTSGDRNEEDLTRLRSGGLDPLDRSISPPIQADSQKHRRFSMLRFRNASDSQLSARIKQQQLQEAADNPLPPTQTPSIITTAPTMQLDAEAKKPRLKLTMRMRRSGEVAREGQGLPETPSGLGAAFSSASKRRRSMNERTLSSTSTTSKHTVTFEEPLREQAEGNDYGATLTPPAPRASESSRSEYSFHDPGISRSTTASTSSASSFFRLGRRKPKQSEPMFPIAHLQQKGKSMDPAAGSSSSLVPSNKSRTSVGQDRATTPVASPTHGLGLFSKAAGSPATPKFRPPSQHSGQSSPTRGPLGLRGRSSTMSSLGGASLNERSGQLDPPRNSASIGRKSFGDLLGLSRMRPNVDGLRQGTLTPATPASNNSKNNSLQLPREPVVTLPERREDDSPAKYLARVEDELKRSVIAAALSKPTDPFFAAVLRSYMRKFSFFEEPMDMAIRKLLMEAELPKETQQIDRCLEAFANRYHECNPGIYSNPEQAYFIAFSLLILHTDVFNKNNKHKMQKPDYLKNTSGEGIFDEILECFYDNISYTPFIHVEDDNSINGSGEHKVRKSIFPHGPTEPHRKSKDPIDPYTLIIDNKLDVLRPPLKDQIPLEEHLSYLGTAKELNLKELQKTFFRTGVLQIVSARSRPDAFMTEKTSINPEEAHVGIVDIKVTKVGLLWRKDAKKKKTRSPWQEWGAILTGSQLYFFRNIQWVKNLIHQYDAHIKDGQDGIPLIFKPPLDNFKPDALMSTEGAVALFDTEYKKHKNSFVYVRHGGLEEVLLAPTEDDRNDWLAKLNYAAAFRSTGVRMRGTNHEGQTRRAIRRLDSSEPTQLVQTPTGEVSINRGLIDQQMFRDIHIARRRMMAEKIEELTEKLQTADKSLETQLRNARHIMVLAPIQEKTREQVRAGASRIIALLKWSRSEIWRLKCYQDILRMDLEEERAANGDLGDTETASLAHSADRTSLRHKESKGSSRLTLPQSPPSLSSVINDALAKQTDGGSPNTDVFQTPPTSATAPGYQVPSLRDLPGFSQESLQNRKTSVSSMNSSAAGRALSSTDGLTSPSAGPNGVGHEPEVDAGERQVLEQAGLLEIDAAGISAGRPHSFVGQPDEETERSKKSRGSVSDKDKLERNKIRRSLQRTLRDGAGHLSHHRSRRGKDSSSSAALSDETVREEILSRGTGSFTVHGKKASVINFGDELQNLSPEERMRQRKQSQQLDENGVPMSPGSVDDDFHSIVSGEPSEDRRGSNASASTATARSFRELHRKYSTTRSQSRGRAGGLTVPSDNDDSDAAISFSDGRRTPLPPLDDEDELDDEEDGRAGPRGMPRRSVYLTPEPPADASDSESEDDDDDGDNNDAAGRDATSTDKAGSSLEKGKDVERLPSPPVQAVSA